MQNEQHPLNDSVESIKNFQNKMEEAAGKTEDVKDGTSTKEEEKQEPAYVLFSAIAETSINILQMPAVIETFDAVSAKIGDELTKKLIEAITLIMTNSAYQAVSFYDGMLKDELNKELDNISNSINMVAADVNAHTGVLEVFKARLDKFEKGNKIDEIKKEIGES